MTFYHGIKSDHRVPGKVYVPGDMLGEWFYGFLMVAVVCGIIGGYSEILLESNLGYGRIYLTVVLLVLTFGVNITWGIIDGTTVIFGGLTDKADLERTISKLKKDRINRELRDKVLDLIGHSSADYLPDKEKEKIVDRIIDEASYHAEVSYQRGRPQHPDRYRFL